MHVLGQINVPVTAPVTALLPAWPFRVVCCFWRGIFRRERTPVCAPFCFIFLSSEVLVEAGDNLVGGVGDLCGGKTEI